MRLPRDIQKGIVLLLDATLATGAAAMMAIRVLLDHHVEEKNIILVSLLTTEQGKLEGLFLNQFNLIFPLCLGIHNVAYAFPKVKIATSAVDPELNENCFILPGNNS